MSQHSRQYTILELLGRGGQGNVYHARMEDSGGFRKDVAIKLLKDGLSDESIQRFRDEARILGLVRDRALVAVDPPILLGGRCALVMELADGLSAQLILARAGPLPLSVTLEVLGELARLLDKMYQLQGPDGQPLHLLHRDIKPANIQVTSEGEVKLLDFGVARADFDERETQTVQHIGGTFGFIAPERLRGVNSPACDIFSLGVTLRVLLTGEKPSTMGPATLAALSPELYDAITLAEEMRNDLPERRPSASEVERRARELRAKVEGPSLREWSSSAVPRLKRPMDDPLIGAVLTESTVNLASGTSPTEPPSLSPVPMRRIVMLAGVLLMLVWAGAIVVLGLIAQKVWTAEPIRTTQGEPLPDTGLAADTRALSGAIEIPVVPVEATPPTPDKLVAPLVAGEPPPQASRKPASARAAPPQTPPPAQTLERIDIDSATPASVWVDDRMIGKTPQHALMVTAGTHRIRLVSANNIVEATVLVGGRRGSSRFHWDGGPAIEAR